MEMVVGIPLRISQGNASNWCSAFSQLRKVAVWTVPDGIFEAPSGNQLPVVWLYNGSGECHLICVWLELGQRGRTEENFPSASCSAQTKWHAERTYACSQHILHNHSRDHEKETYKCSHDCLNRRSIILSPIFPVTRRGFLTCRLWYLLLAAERRVEQLCRGKRVIAGVSCYPALQRAP